MPYNKLNALIYELIIFLCRFYPLKRKPWIRRILDYCRPDWAAFRAEVAMKEVDKQVEDLHAQWDEEEKVYLVYEDWCTECHVIRKRVEVFSRTTPVKVVEELPNYEI